MPVGVNLGDAFGAGQPNGFVLGGEVSIVLFLFPPGFWFGIVGDGAYDFGAQAFRHRVGPEIGWKFVGVELAYLGQLREGEYTSGISVRGVLSASVLSLYGGYGHLSGKGNASTAGYGEFGVLLKFPIPLHIIPRAVRRRPIVRPNAAPPQPPPTRPGTPPEPTSPQPQFAQPPAK